MKITEDIVYLGVDDTELDLFEGQYAVPEGMAYNSYLIKDEKLAVLDTVDKNKVGEWLENLKNALDGKAPDYLIISHMEPDHSSGIKALAAEYPRITLVGNEKTFVLLDRFFAGTDAKRLVVKDGGELSLGKHNLKFFTAAMVHWPEVMFTYDKTDKTLFSADAFGKFGANSLYDGDWACEARRYYFNIVGKYGLPVQGVLKKLSGLDINAICPLHGPVLTENISYYTEKYAVWSAYEPEDNGVLIAYGSVYGNTAGAAEALAAALRERGEKVVVSDLARSDMAEVIEDAFRYDRMVIASVTYDAGVFPVVETFINELKAKNYQNRTVAVIENGSWAPCAGKLIREKLETMKNVALKDTVTVKSVLTDESRAQISALAAELCK